MAVGAIFVIGSVMGAVIYYPRGLLFLFTGLFFGFMFLAGLSEVYTGKDIRIE